MDFRKGRLTRFVEHLEGLTCAEQLFAWPYEPSPLSMELFAKMSPDALAIPSVRDDTDRLLLEKLYQHPLIGDTQQTWHAETVSYDYHMGNDKKKHFLMGGKGIALHVLTWPGPWTPVACSALFFRMVTQRDTP